MTQRRGVLKNYRGKRSLTFDCGSVNANSGILQVRWTD